MKKLFRNSLIASVVAVAGAAGFAGEAKAQTTATVQFDGTVGNACAITPVEDGDIGLIDENDAFLSSKPSESTGAKLAQVSVTCGGSGDISVAEPTAVGEAAENLEDNFGSSFKNAELYNDADASGSQVANSYDIASGVVASNGQPVPMYVHIATGTGDDQSVPPGVYTYTTTVTVAPQ